MRRNAIFGTFAATGVALLALAAPARGDIDLEFRADAATVAVGDVVDVGLYAVSDDAGTQSFSAVQAIFTWDPVVLALVSTTSDGAIPLLVNSVPANGDFGLNEVLPPADGDGFLLCLAQLGTPAAATPEGVLLHTFAFEALAPDAATAVDLAPTGGEGGQTFVVDGEVPGLAVTGALVPAVIEVADASCPGDLDDDGQVAFSDLLELLSAWGPCAGCAADLDGDDEVAFGDLLVLLSAWGPC